MEARLGSLLSLVAGAPTAALKDPRLVSKP